MARVSARKARPTVWSRWAWLSTAWLMAICSGTAERSADGAGVHRDVCRPRGRPKVAGLAHHCRTRPSTLSRIRPARPSRLPPAGNFADSSVTAKARSSLRQPVRRGLAPSSEPCGTIPIDDLPADSQRGGGLPLLSDRLWPGGRGGRRRPGAGSRGRVHGAGPAQGPHRHPRLRDPSPRRPRLGQSGAGGPDRGPHPHAPGRRRAFPTTPIEDEETFLIGNVASGSSTPRATPRRASRSS